MNPIIAAFIGLFLGVSTGGFWKSSSSPKTKNNTVLEFSSEENSNESTPFLPENWDQFRDLIERLVEKGEHISTTLMANAGDVYSGMDWLNSRDGYSNSAETMITTDNLRISHPGKPSQKPVFLFVNGYRFRLFGATLSISPKRVKVKFEPNDKISWRVGNDELQIQASSPSGRVKLAGILPALEGITPIKQLKFEEKPGAITIHLQRPA